MCESVSKKEKVLKRKGVTELNRKQIVQAGWKLKVLMAHASLNVKNNTTLKLFNS